MFKKSLLILSIPSLFILTACLGDNGGGQTTERKLEVSQEQTQKSLNNYGEKNWQTDPLKKYSLYKVTTDHENNKCKTFKYIADQMTTKECFAMKRLNMERDELADADTEGYQARFVVSGPHEGKEAWLYGCLTEYGIESWQKNSVLCE